MPDGLILIPDSALTKLHNEAQLAFALSAAIQATLQKEAHTACRRCEKLGWRRVWPVTCCGRYDVTDPAYN